MDDFERATLIVFNCTGSVDAELKERAAAFVNEIKKSPEVWRLCTERFSITVYAEVKFWCLQTLHEVIKISYAALPLEARAMIKAALMTWVQRDCNNPQAVLPPYLRNKIAQTLVAVLQFEFPSEWPGFFQDLIRTLPAGEGVVDMFCRILVAVDEDLVSLDIPRSQDESKLSMHVKDSMRDHAITDVAGAWYQLVEALHGKSPALAAAVLQTMQRYINWIDINLVANDKFVHLLDVLLESPSTLLRGASADCLSEIISKRMDAVPKLALVQNLKVVPRCAMWAAGFPVPRDAEDAEELLLKLAHLLATLAGEIMDSLKRVENGVISLTAMGFAVGDDAAAEVTQASETANKLLEQLFPAVMSAFKSEVDEVALPLLPFMSAYVARLKTLHKRNQGLSPDCLMHVRVILEGLAVCARYPRDSCAYEGAAPSPPEMAAAKEEQGEVEEKRRDLFTLFRNIAKLAFNEALAFVGGLLQAAIARPQATWQEVEVSVVLLYELGEGAGEEALKGDSGQLGQLAQALMQATLPASHHRLVALAVLETYVRYVRVVHSQQQAAALLPGVLMTFLDGRGLGHPAEDVSTRACYLFCRLVKTLRQHMRPFIPTILQNLQPHLVRVATTPIVDTPAAQTGRDASTKALAPANAVVDDRLYVFEAVGLMLGQEEVGAEEQASMLSALLQPLTQQIQANMRSRAAPAGPLSSPGGAAGGGLLSVAGAAPPGTSAPGLILQALEAIVRLNKGFRTDLCTRTRPEIGQMFVRCLEVAIAVPREFPAHKLLRARVMSSVHRLVESLQAMLLPVLPSALEVLVGTQADAGDLVEVITLTNQLISRFKEALAPLLEGLLPTLVARVHATLDAGWDWTGRMAAPAAMASAQASDGGAVSATLEEARERGELQRSYYSLVYTMCYHGLAATLLKVPPQVLDVIMGALTRGASSHVDPTVRRTCVQVFERLVGDWCSNGGEVVPGFRRFAMEQLGEEACLRGLLRSSPPLDVRDAGTVALLGEAATALKLVYEKCGDEFPAHLCSVVLPALGAPQAVQQQLVFHLRESGPRELKDWLRAVLVQANAANAQAGQPQQLGLMMGR